MRNISKMLVLGAALMFMGSIAHAQTATANAPATLNLTVSNEATIAIDANTPLATALTSFADYTGTTNYHYQVRTTTSGTITFQITTDFSAGGSGLPSVA